MVIYVKLSPTATATFDNLPREEQRKARIAIDRLKTGQEELLKPHFINRNQGLKRGDVSKKIKVIYKVSSTGIDVINFVNFRHLAGLVTTSQGA
ncbi:hypothetical protein AB6D67_03395 [Vibrio splendidus]